MSVLDDIAIVGVAGALVFVGYEILQVNHGLSNPLGLTGQGSTPANVGSAIGNAAGTAAASAVGSAAGSIWLGGNSVCDFVRYWRQAGAPNLSVLGFNVPFSGGGDPNNWSAFRSWMTWSNQYDPGPDLSAAAGCW